MARETHNMIGYEDRSNKKIYGRFIDIPDAEIHKMTHDQVKKYVNEPGRIEYNSLKDFAANAPHRSGRNWGYVLMADGTWRTYENPEKASIMGIPPTQP